ncbi:MAG: response regulator, partial [Candidatus Rokuibacteriota bacterium]
PTAGPRDQRPSPAGDLAGVYVLVVEDDADSRAAVQLMLEARGAHVLVAEDGAAALRICQSAPRLHVIVSDLSMPNVDGFELARRLRADPRCASLPIVALTGMGRDLDHLRTLEAGFTAHLQKPADPDVLVALIRHLLGKRRGAS